MGDHSGAAETLLWFENLLNKFTESVTFRFSTEANCPTD